MLIVFILTYSSNEKWVHSENMFSLKGRVCFLVKEFHNISNQKLRWKRERSGDKCSAACERPPGAHQRRFKSEGGTKKGKEKQRQIYWRQFRRYGTISLSSTQIPYSERFKNDSRFWWKLGRLIIFSFMFTFYLKFSHLLNNTQKIYLTGSQKVKSH